MSHRELETRNLTLDVLDVKAQTHRRTALVELRGELDIATASQVAEVHGAVGMIRGSHHTMGAFALVNIHWSASLPSPSRVEPMAL